MHVINSPACQCYVERGEDENATDHITGGAAADGCGSFM